MKIKREGPKKAMPATKPAGKKKYYRPGLTDEDLDWCVTGLRSQARTKGRGSARKEYLERLANRLAERTRGNPKLRS